MYIDNNIMYTTFYRWLVVSLGVFYDEEHTCVPVLHSIYSYGLEVAKSDNVLMLL